MLKLHPIFQDAIVVLSRHASQLQLPALPATVCLMQQDVINHYRHAATHYLPLTLQEHFLQNSSLGTPYEKWMKFTNDDFDVLAFTITNLMRYTARLIHETETIALKEEKLFSEASERSNEYIGPLVEINDRNRQIGIKINADQTLTLTPFSTDTAFEGRIVSSSNDQGNMEWWQITVDTEGNETNRAISVTEFQELNQKLREQKISLGNRSVLGQLKAEALIECEELSALHEKYRAICESYCTHHKVTTPFRNMHQSWWL